MNIQDEVQKIHSKFRTNELANYKIQLLCEEYAKQHHESELKKMREAQVMQRSEQLFAFLEYCDNAGWIKNVDKKRIIEDYEKANNCV